MLYNKRKTKHSTIKYDRTHPKQNTTNTCIYCCLHRRRPAVPILSVCMIAKKFCIQRTYTRVYIYCMVVWRWRKIYILYVCTSVHKCTLSFYMMLNKYIDSVSDYQAESHKGLVRRKSSEIFIVSLIAAWIKQENSTQHNLHTHMCQFPINPINSTWPGDLLTHWGRVTQICFSKLTIIGSDNVLAPGRRQAIIWTNDGTLLFSKIRNKF